MENEEKQKIVEMVGLDVLDAEVWFEKYRRHTNATPQRGLRSELSFKEYLDKAKESGITNPSLIGREKGQYSLGRIGDVGNYAVDTCRFITVEQNHRERYENEGGRRRIQAMIGQTKETSERVRKMSETLTGRTKHNDPGVAAMAESRAKRFVMISPDKIEYSGSNLLEFCQRHELTAVAMYAVFAGRRQHHKGWTGYYVD